MRHVSKEEKERRIRGAEGIMNTKTNEERPRQSENSQVNDVERIVMDVWMGIYQINPLMLMQAWPLDSFKGKLLNSRNDAQPWLLYNSLVCGLTLTCSPPSFSASISWFQ